MTPKLEKIIHEECLPGALIEGYGRTLTYKIDEDGKLKCVQFVADGCCLNKEREITRNPLYEDIICSIIPLGLSTFIGAYAGFVSKNMEVGLTASSVLYLLTLPLGRQISADIVADKLAWKKYQIQSKMKLIR